MWEGFVWYAILFNHFFKWFAVSACRFKVNHFKSAFIVNKAVFQPNNIQTPTLIALVYKLQGFFSFLTGVGKYKKQCPICISFFQVFSHESRSTTTGKRD